MQFLGLFLLFLGCPVILGVSNSYSDIEARRLLVLSAGAYGNSTNQQSCASLLFQSNSFHILSSFSVPCDPANHTCYGYVAESPDEKRLYFIFSGTRKLNQALLEFLSGLLPQTEFYGMGKVMGYFAQAHVLLWPKLVPHIANPNYKDYTFVFSGHSLGGSMATLAAARCALIGYCPPEQTIVYTFGEPRTGSVQFANNFNGKLGEHFRIVHGWDPITQFPFCERTLGFWSFFFPSECDITNPLNPYHHGIEIWYDNNMSTPTYKTCNEVTQPVGCPVKLDVLKLERYYRDHQYYFTVPVPDFGMSGCTSTEPIFSLL